MIRAAILALVLMTLIGCQTSNAQYRDVTIAEAEKLMERSDTYLLDVRTQEEYNEAHLEGAKLLPVSELESRLPELEIARDKEIIVYCRSGNRSTKASEILSKHGYKVANVEGGITAWQAAGKPVVSGSQ